MKLKSCLRAASLLLVLPVLFSGCGGKNHNTDSSQTVSAVSEEDSQAVEKFAADTESTGSEESVHSEKYSESEGEKSAVAPEGPSEEFRSSHTFFSDLPDQDLEKPDGEIGSLEEFAYALDYLAFYGISDKVYVTFTPEYQTEFYNPYQVFQKAYTSADLADVFACQMDDTDWSSQHTVAVKYSISRDMASEAPEVVTDTPVVPSFDYRENKGGNFQIPLLADQEKKAIPCQSGEQLYYLAMNGYRPEPEEGSMAEKLYTETEKVLQSILEDDMTDFQKIKAVYDWLTTRVVYDSDTAYSLDTYLVKKQAYYLEGVFLDRCAVCDGKAKAYALMLNMLEIPCYRDTGTSEDGDHAWNMVQLNGKWYISCTTYGQADASESVGRILPNYATLLSGKETPYGDGWGFKSQKHSDIAAKLEEKGFDIYQEMSEADGLTLKSSDPEELLETLDAVSSKMQPENTEYKVELFFEGNEDQAGAFEQKLKDYLALKQNANAMKIKSEEGQAYQVFYLDGSI